MTGEKNRYQTQEKLWNNDDKTLATPAHDELVMMLLDEEQCKKIIPELASNIRFRDTFHHTMNPQILHSSSATGYYNIKTGIKDRTDISGLSKKEKEEYLKNHIFGKGYHNIELLGDNCPEECKTFKITQPDLITRLDKLYDISICSEVPIISGSNRFIIGYWDIIIKYKLKNNPFERDCKGLNSEIYGCGDSGISRGRCWHSLNAPIEGSIYIEVKPKIDSFGATLRQIKTYMTYANENSNIYLFTPDTKYMKQFESQGIKVITPFDENYENNILESTNL